MNINTLIFFYFRNVSFVDSLRRSFLIATNYASMFPNYRRKALYDILMASGVQRCSAKMAKTAIEDYVVPFLFGFFGVLLFLWVYELFTKGPPSVSPLTFQDKNGQLYLQRHGLMDESDIHRLRANPEEFSIQADASDGFKRRLVHSSKVPGNSSKDESDDPPGTVWSWPRIERDAPSTPLVWVVTPTYRNLYQFAELTRVAQALYPARKFVRWLIVDDSTKSRQFPEHFKKLKKFLGDFSVNFTLLPSIPKPKGQRTVYNPKGVDARRTAIKYIRRMKLKGVVYFADDDNTYDSDIFRQMQATKTVSIWPTGAITQWTVSGPVINSEGKVVDFFDAWVANRKFPVDFASIAVNCDLLHANSRVNIPWIQGYEETVFLSTIGVHPSEFQPLAANATEVLTWHTKTMKSFPHNQNKMKTLLLQLSKWPITVQRLVKKYDFLFDSSPLSEIDPTHKPVEDYPILDTVKPTE